jgi:hypothetical protein
MYHNTTNHPTHATTSYSVVQPSTSECCGRTWRCTGVFPRRQSGGRRERGRPTPSRPVRTAWCGRRASCGRTRWRPSARSTGSLGLPMGRGALVGGLYTGGQDEDEDGGAWWSAERTARDGSGSGGGGGGGGAGGWAEGVIDAELLVPVVIITRGESGARRGRPWWLGRLGGGGAPACIKHQATRNAKACSAQRAQQAAAAAGRIYLYIIIFQANPQSAKWCHAQVA